MSAGPRVERPEGDPPRASQACALCKAPPNTPHRPDCPWRLWAEYWSKQ